MSVPNFEEIFDELNVYSTKLQQAGEIEFADTDELASQVATMLYNSEDFINFMGATYVTANEFLENRGAKSVVGTFKDFIDSIKIDKETLQMPKVVDGKITAKIKIVGSVAIPVTLYYNAGSERNIGNVVISFSAYVNLDYLKLESNFIQEEMENADNEKILEVTKKILADIIAYDGEVFGNTKKECGNYLDLDLEKAKEECRKYLEVLQNEQTFEYKA